MHWHRILPTLAVIALLAACGEAPLPTATSTPASVEASATLPTDPGRTPQMTDGSTPEPALPAVPEDFPLLPGMVSIQPRDAVTIAEWQLEEVGREAYEFYQAALPAAGYVVELDAPGGAAAGFIFRTPDGRRLSLGIMTVGELTHVSLSVPPE